MFRMIYKKTFYVMSEKPVELWGISLLYILLVNLALMLFGTVIAAGFAAALLLETAMVMIFLAGFRGDEVHTEQLFDCFHTWETAKRVLIGMAWRELWIFVWALIPVAGIYYGLRRCYEYRLVPYILMTEPEIAPTEALRVSRERTEGYKTVMFQADLAAVAVPMIPIALLLYAGTIPIMGIVFQILAVLLTAAALAILPLFLGLLHAGFYEEIMNPTIQEEEEEEESWILCPVCGEQNLLNSRFCCGCGTRFENDEP